MLKKIQNYLRNWARDEGGMAAVEAAMIFPVLLILLVGTFDMGNGILANQKTIRASQVVADLVTRNRSITAAEISEAVDAGELALQPFETAEYGVDIVSIRFDEDAQPEIAWRETRNMAASADVLDNVASLAEANGGVVVVTVQYLFEPAFAGFVVNEIQMQETAFARGRRSAVVNLE